MDQLRRGGYVLAFRHASADFSMADETRDLRECTRQRNVNEAGRRQPRTFGSSLAGLGVTVGDVLANPYCRTRDTARLAFGRLRSTTALLSGRYFASRSARARQPTRLRRLLGAPPRSGTNAVLVSHAFAIEDAIGLSPAEGEAAAVAPDTGPHCFEVLGRVEADEWARRARRSPPGVELREYKVFEGPDRMTSRRRTMARSGSRRRRPARSADWTRGLPYAVYVVLSLAEWTLPVGVGDTVRDTILDDRPAAYDPGMAAERKRGEWTLDEVRAQRARVRRDAGRGLSRNLSDVVAHTEFAKRFADAFKRARRA